MLNFLGKVLLHSASLIPVFLVYSDCALRAGEVAECVGYLIVCGLLWFLSSTAINHSMKFCECMSFKFTDLEPVENFSTIWGLYFIPSIISSFTPLGCDVVIFVVLTVTIACLLDKDYRLNLVLSLFGWRIYKVNTHVGCTYTLLSKKKLRRGNNETVIIQLTGVYAAGYRIINLKLR